MGKGDKTNRQASTFNNNMAFKLLNAERHGLMTTPKDKLHVLFLINAIAVVVLSPLSQSRQSFVFRVGLKKNGAIYVPMRPVPTGLKCYGDFGASYHGQTQLKNVIYTPLTLTAANDGLLFVELQRLAGRLPSISIYLFHCLPYAY